MTPDGHTSPDEGRAAYRQPPWILRRIGIPMMRLLVGRFGVSGASVLEVTDPASGQSHSTPLHVLDTNGARYLVSARGEAHWVLALRAAGRATLRRGRTGEHVVAVELAIAERPPILRDYLKTYWKDVGGQFAVESAEASDAELQAIASEHPVFRIEAA